MIDSERKKGRCGFWLEVLALVVAIVAVGAFVLVRPFGPSPQDGVWRVSSPEPRFVVVQVDFTAVERTTGSLTTLFGNVLHATRQAHCSMPFVQRCCGSSEKCAPRTAWGDEPCHLQVGRGTFPPDAADYAAGKDTSSGFFTVDGRRVAVSHFDVIRRNTNWTAAPESFPGGWHDANDNELVHTQEEIVRWPIWRRRVNLEGLHVPSGEYSVSETIGPALAVTAYLADLKGDALERCPPPHPRGRPDDLPGHWALP